jgi:hypothetical protein
VAYAGERIAGPLFNRTRLTSGSEIRQLLVAVGIIKHHAKTCRAATRTWVIGAARVARYWGGLTAAVPAVDGTGQRRDVIGFCRKRG